MAIMIIASMLSGCTSTSNNTPTTAPTSGNSGSASVAAGSGDKITVTQTGNTITITGGKGKKMQSDKFPLSNDAWYIIKSTYTGGDVGDFISAIATQKMIDDDTTVGGQLTLWMGPNTATVIKDAGTYNTDDYLVYIDQADGPWTIQIQKSPAPSPVSSDTKFSGKGTSVTPFFHLNKGSATFTVNQQASTGLFSGGIEVSLYNADTGKLVAFITHNNKDAQITDTEDIPADGNYIMEAAGADSWDISYSQ